MCFFSQKNKTIPLLLSRKISSDHQLQSWILLHALVLMHLRLLTETLYSSY